MRTCTALVFPGEEDFGLVPVEAQACGSPVIARRAGGALETVEEGRTGLFFDGGAEELAGTLATFDGSVFDPSTIRTHAEQFSAEHFESNLRREVAAMGVDVDG
jgi:glycosyltransferase involved in cell wall biosynthesis